MRTKFAGVLALFVFAVISFGCSMHYLPAMGWDDYNLAATIGAAVIGLSVLVFVVNFFWSRAAGRVAGADPWGADSLEWATASPPASRAASINCTST